MRLPLLLLLIFAGMVVAEPTGHFRVLRMDRATATSLHKALNEGTLPEADLMAKIDSLITGKTITEIANLSEKTSVQMKFEEPSDPITVKEIKESIPMGLTLEASANLSPDGPVVDQFLRFTLREKEGAQEYAELEGFSMGGIQAGRWHWNHHWSTSDTTTVLLTKYTSVPEQGGKTEIKRPEMAFEFEMLSVSPADLERFGKSTPATRQKAIDWLKGQAEFLDGGKIDCPTGMNSEHRNQIQALTKNGGEWNTSSGGSHMFVSPIIASDGGTLDLGIEGSWQDRSDPKLDPDYRFEVGDTYPAGARAVILPATQPEGAKATVVMLVSLNVTMPAREPVKDVVGELGDGLTSRTYRVPPGFQRLLHGEPGVLDQPSLRDLLQKQGMAFPVGTQAAFMANTCTVVLRQNREGHEAFMEIREKARNDG